MVLVDPVDDLGRLWEFFADSSCRGYSPLYERICRSVARDRTLLDTVRQAPPPAHLPTVLLAAVHYLLLGGASHRLAEVYAGGTVADPAPLFKDFCLDHHDELLEVMAARHTQTNEVGRSALIGPALSWVAERFGGPLRLVDVGSSAGLNLWCDRYLLDYGDHGVTGPADAEVCVECRVVQGTPPIRPRLPPVNERVGIDRDPPDLSDPDDARWLLACVWPDTGRLHRSQAAIEFARRSPVHLVRGDALAVLGDVVGGLGPGGTVCVLTTWAFAYFLPDERRRFIDELAEAGQRRLLVWIAGEGPGVVDLIEPTELPDHGGGEPSVLTAVSFDAHGLHAHHLGFAQSHGQWLDWRAPG